MGKIESLSVDLIKTDAGTQMRAKVDDDVVSTYADLWRAKHEFPPLDVFFDGTTYVLGDGFHRLYGAKAAKRSSVPCVVRPGDFRDAILFACSANHDNGLHRTNADKRCAVEALLDDPEWKKRTHSWIAETCRVSNRLVATIVADRKPSVLATTQKSQDAQAQPSQPGGNKRERREGKDGKLYPATGGNGQAASDKPKTDKPKQHDDSFDTEAMIVRDAFEVAVPEGLTDVFGQCDKWTEAMNAVSQAKKFVSALSEHAAATWLDVAETERVLGQARTNLKFAMPYTECVKCRRKPKKDCPHCKGLGWLNKPTFEACASDPDKAWLEERQ